MKLLLSVVAFAFLFSKSFVKAGAGAEKSSEATSSEDGCLVSTECPTKPCPRNEVRCVKKYFQGRANCLSYICHLNSNKLILENFKNYVPVINATFIQNATVTGLNSGEIVDYIVDTTNNLAVLSIEYSNINITGIADFNYYQSCKEPKTVRATTTEFYSSFIITTYFYDLENLSFDNSYSVANIPELPTIVLGPCVTESKDPAIQSFYSGFLENAAPSVLEAFQTRAPTIQKYYISKNICNYIKKD